MPEERVKPIVVIGPNWCIPPVSGSTVNGPCMEASYLTTDKMYVSCGEPATVRLWDPKAQRCYDFCAACGEHNLRRGMVPNQL